MGFSCGIIGLPNVGKSTLFNALTQTASAAAENYPFCTIEPNLGEVAVPDSRLNRLAEIAHSKQVIPATISFADIAGLVRGASKGEGLGNQFLAHIRETDALVHVARCFENDDISHVEGRINPVADIELVETELMLADLESLARRQYALEKKARGQNKEAQDAQAELELAIQARQILNKGQPIHNQLELAPLQLLSSKKQLYVANVSEADLNGNDHTQALQRYAAKRKAPMIILAAATEAQLIALNPNERLEYLQTLELDEPSLNRLIRSGYQMLGLITFFTAGEKETRAWTIPNTSQASVAAGRIHSDFEKQFIRAEIIPYQDFVQHQGAASAAKAGKLRLEGKNYLVCDGDVIYFRTGN